MIEVKYLGFLDLVCRSADRTDRFARSPVLRVSRS